MADWRGLQESLVSGFEVGQKSGGRLAGLGSIIGKVADRLRSQREQGEALELLGKTEELKTKYNPKEWKSQTKEEALEFERSKRLGKLIKMGSKYYTQTPDGFEEVTVQGTEEEAPSIEDKPPAPTGFLNPLRIFPGYAHYGENKEGAYKSLKSRSISEKNAISRTGYNSIKSENNLEQKAIKELQDAGYPVTPANIKAVIGQL